MIVHSIRLKNIRSYGEGSNGDGVTVPFQPGVNRVAGRNGHGKSTLIESLGMALFSCEPEFDENFRVETYLLRHGCKAGEIDITFEHDGKRYRVERGIGSANRRRAKVIDLADQSICAENDREVEQFLCALFGFPDKPQLQEIFSKLIGVKQGRLTWPFDSKRGEAKSYFEPLLDVQIFRDCFEQLKPVADTFRDQKHAQDVLRSAVEQQIKERADSPQKLADARQSTALRKDESTKASAALAAAKVERALHESREQKAHSTRAASAEAAAVAKGAAERKMDAEKLAWEAETAAKTCAEEIAAHEAFIAAEAECARLEAVRAKRDEVQKMRDSAERSRLDCAGKAEGAAKLAALLSEQRAQKENEAEELQERARKVAGHLDKTESEFKAARLVVEEARRHQSLLNTWAEGVGRAIERVHIGAGKTAAAESEIASWNPDSPAASRQIEETVANDLRRAREELAGAQRHQLALEAQLKQIAGGSCPFLKEQCRQFEPSKVQTELSERQASLAAAAKLEKSLATKLLEATGEVKRLEKAEERIAYRKREREESVGRIKIELAALLPETVAQASERLRQFETKIPTLKGSPGMPVETSPAHLKALETQLRDFNQHVRGHQDETNAALEARFREFERMASARQKEEAELENLEKLLIKTRGETAKLAQDFEARRADHFRLEAEAAAFAKRASDLEDQLRPFANLESEMNAQRLKRDQNRGGHERYQHARKLADDLFARRENLAKRTEEAIRAATAAETAMAAAKIAESEFDPANLQAARANYDAAHGAAAVTARNLQEALETLQAAEVREAEWTAACREREVIIERISRLRASIEITELARKLLPKAAPAVAQYLCNDIAAAAQALFNKINPDPIALAWNAENYGLLITPGDRRFAMLSGGEQTKLALSLTLAMIEKLGRLRFCIFDEPTYGVDADSRQNLAEAILEAVEAAKLDQLILVSHDEAAFESHIDYTVKLTKTAAGTRVMEG